MLLHLHRIFRCTITQQQPFIRNGLPHTRCCASGGIAATEAAKPIKYTDTINLPKTKFPARLTAKKRAEVERRINETHFARLYQWQRSNLPTPAAASAAATATDFVLHDGPPYANGDLHMGHAINKILKDIVLRRHVIGGRRVHYRPGWDCHGLPIELKAIGNTTTAPPANATGRQHAAVDIRQRARRFAAATVERQRDAFAGWGVMADWRRADGQYLTMDAAYVRNQLRTFQRLYAAGLVYRDLKPVYWSPSSRTALAEAELEYDAQHVSPSLTLRCRLANVDGNGSGSDESLLHQKLHAAGIDARTNVYALIWTTTPWSLPANRAICVNAQLRYNVVRLHGHSPRDVYLIASDLMAVQPFQYDGDILATLSGTDLIGAHYHHPLDATELVPILDASHVQATKGTGLVHTAPAHGPDDFLVGLQQQWPVRSLVDEAGAYNADAPAFLRGRSVLGDGNRLVLERVAADVVHLDSIVHSYPIDWRTKQPVLLRASEQWFINTQRIRDAAVDALATVAVHPHRTAAANRANLVGQLQRRPYWCISRQRAWGTPIPVFYNRRTGAAIVDERIVERVCDLLAAPDATADLWWTLPVGELIPSVVLDELQLKAADVRRGHDILDIWFDSGVSWSYALDDADGNGRRQRVADLYLEGHDQFTGWFQSSLMTSVALQQCAPYRALFVHGFAVDEQGAKMSKSLGNIVRPADIIATYGVDTLRWWVAHHATQHTSVPVGPQTLQAAADCVHKCRATLRYLVGCVGGGDDAQTSAENVDEAALLAVDEHFLHALECFAEEMRTLYESHQYNRAAAAILNFVTNEVSASYLHLIKDRLYCGRATERDALRRVLRAAYVRLSLAMWPIAPFVVEECWGYHNERMPFYEYALADGGMEPLMGYDSHERNAEALASVAVAQRLKQLLNQTVRDQNTWTVHATIGGPARLLDALAVLQTQRMRPQYDSQLCELLQLGGVTLVPDEQSDAFTIGTRTLDGVLCARCRRFSVPVASGVCARCENVLLEKTR